jgi:uroporphyrinogen decarboxylase
VTLQPVRRLGLDAAILFSDILVPAEPMGFEITFNPGPVIANPVREASDVARLLDPEPEQAVPYVYETIRLLRRELTVPLIGFAAAPLTLAAYLVEGQGSKNFSRLKGLLHGDPKTAHALLDRIATVTERYLLAQARAGAQVLQLFDTWAGLHDRATYREFGLRYVRRVLTALEAAGVPRIYFPLDAAHLLEDVASVDAEVIGVDWRMSLTEASARLGQRFVLQGNLDPAVLAASGEAAVRQARGILREGDGLPGHLFNLGHGVLPETPVAHAEALVRAVHEHRPGAPSTPAG